MKIQVLENFGGRETKERRVLPGEYDINDPLLFGAGQVLLALGKAVVIETDAPPVVSEVETDDEPEETKPVSKPNKRR